MVDLFEQTGPCEEEANASKFNLQLKLIWSLVSAIFLFSSDSFIKLFLGWL